MLYMFLVNIDNVENYKLLENSYQYINFLVTFLNLELRHPSLSTRSNFEFKNSSIFKMNSSFSYPTPPLFPLFCHFNNPSQYNISFYILFSLI